jgi:hypothetical protein
MSLPRHKPGKIPGINNVELKRPTKVYDVDEKDPDKKLLGAFESVTAAAKFAGMKPRNISSYIKSKSRCHTNGLGKTLAFR